MRVAKWGNSLGVRLPASLVDELDLKPGDEVDIRAVKPASIELARRPSIREMLENLRQYRGVIPADFKFDRDEANERG